jgi:hypothetical protein
MCVCVCVWSKLNRRHLKNRINLILYIYILYIYNIIFFEILIIWVIFELVKTMRVILYGYIQFFSVFFLLLIF